MNQFNRPKNPDFWLISQALIDNDAAADSGQPIGDMIGRYLDPESVIYAAMQRALRAAPLQPGTHPKLAALWVDGFVAGMHVQSLKQRNAQSPPDELPE
jgi:hypothetical protein